jgi:putative ABC transport system substrate-binding protein
MRRREFITLAGGAVAAWPLAARAQQAKRVRRVGVLHPLAESDFQVRSWVNILKQTLAALGWNDGVNINFDVRGGGGGDVSQMRTLAKELRRQHPCMTPPSAARSP